MIVWSAGALLRYARDTQTASQQNGKNDINQNTPKNNGEGFAEDAAPVPNPSWARSGEAFEILGRTLTDYEKTLISRYGADLVFDVLLADKRFVISQRGRYDGLTSDELDRVLNILKDIYTDSHQSVKQRTLLLQLTIQLVRTDGDTKLTDELDTLSSIPKSDITQPSITHSTMEQPSNQSNKEDKDMDKTLEQVYKRLFGISEVPQDVRMTIKRVQKLAPPNIGLDTEDGIHAAVMMYDFMRKDSNLFKLKTDLLLQETESTLNASLPPTSTNEINDKGEWTAAYTHTIVPPPDEWWRQHVNNHNHYGYGDTTTYFTSDHRHEHKHVKYPK